MVAHQHLAVLQGGVSAVTSLKLLGGGFALRAVVEVDLLVLWHDGSV